jgi:hypothetical protein
VGKSKSVNIQGSDIAWEWVVADEDIADPALVNFTIRSERAYAREGDYDDTAAMWYRVLPPVRKTTK